jgi:RNA polymerase sigma-B factor
MAVQRLHRLYASSHDRQLEAELLRYHDPLAVHLARRVSRDGDTIEDLSQVARVALLHALRNYDPHRGTQFTSYAAPSIVGALKRHLRDRAWLVRPPRRLQEAYLAVSKAVEELGGELHRDPSIAELVAHSRLAEQDVIESFSTSGARRAVPMDAPSLRSHDGAWDDVVSDPCAAFSGVEDRILVAQLMRLLPKAEREVVALSFLCGLTQAEVASQLGTSQSTVSRLTRKALDYLRALHTVETAAA